MMSNVSRARVKLNYMSQMHSCESQELLEYRKQLKYFKQASLFDINDGVSKNKRKTYQILAKSVVNSDKLDPPKKMKDKYPKLLNELNDSASAIPAYVRF
jgi:F0F1-type ATP synthase epsilon subunit